MISDDSIPNVPNTTEDVVQTGKSSDTAITKQINDFDKLQSEYGGLSGQLAAGTLGLARGLTLGGSDVAANASGLTTPEELKGYSEANPAASGIGNLGGNVALLGLTGGASALTEGAGAAAKITGMGAEGALFGTGNALSESQMGDPNMNAQKIAAHIGTGALFGLGLGSLGQIAKATLPPATQALKSSLNKIIEIATPSTEVGEQPGLLERIMPDIVQKWRDGIATGNLNPATVSRDVAKQVRDVYNSGKKVSEAMYDTADKNTALALQDMPVEQAKTNFTNALYDMKDQFYGVSEAGQPAINPLTKPIYVEKVNDLFDSAEKAVNKADTSYDIHKIMQKTATKLDDRLIKFDSPIGLADQNDQAVLRGLRTTLRSNLRDPETWGQDAATHYGEVTDNYADYMNANKAFEKKFMVKDQNTGKMTVSLPKVNSLFNEMGNQLPAGEELLPSEGKYIMNNMLNKNSHMAQASENYEGFIKGKEDLGSHIDSLAGKNKELQEIARAMGNSAAKTGINIGDVGTGAMIAGKAGIPKMLGAGLVGASKVYNTITNPYQAGATFANTVSKLKILGEMIDKTSASIDSNAKSIFSGNTIKNVTSSLSGLSDQGYEKNANRIKALAEDPNKMMDQMTKTTNGIQEAAPNLTSGLHKSMTQGIQFLNNKLPKPGNELPFNNKWKPTTTQKVKFNSYYHAVNDPIDALKQVKKGTLSSETMEALHAVHPELLQEMQQKVMENMNPKRIASLNYASKISTSKFLGMPLESNMMPQVLASNQATFNPQMQNSQSQSSKSPKSKGTKIKSINIASRMATQTQDIENKDV